MHSGEILLDHHPEKGKGFEIQHPLALTPSLPTRWVSPETHKQYTYSLARLHARLYHKLQPHRNLQITYFSLAHFIKYELTFYWRFHTRFLNFHLLNNGKIGDTRLPC